MKPTCEILEMWYRHIFFANYTLRFLKILFREILYNISVYAIQESLYAKYDILIDVPNKMRYFKQVSYKC